jgi:LCP family protein required for cell wall assembly
LKRIFSHRRPRPVRWRPRRRIWAALQWAQTASQAPEYSVPPGRTLLRLILLGLLAVGACYLSLVSVNLLLLGTDDVDYSQHTDTIMLFHWQPLPRRLALLSIPRDTLITLPKKGPLKINAVYAYGNALNGRGFALAMTRAAVENLLGVKVHAVIHVRYSDFINLVDALGGVPLYVTKAMHYTDHAGGLAIDLSPGYQLLDGRQALDYVRFRHDEDGDLGRIRRQQEFVKAFVTQLVGFTRLPRTLRAFYTFLHQLETDLSAPMALFLALEIKGVVAMPWRQAILPGQVAYFEGKSCWQTKPEEIRQTMLELGQPAQPKTVVEPTPAPVASPAPLRPENPVASAPARATPWAMARPTVQIQTLPRPAAITPAPVATRVPVTKLSVVWPAGPQPEIRVLNGCGTPGLGKRAAAVLLRQQLRLQAKDITNAPNFAFAESVIKTNPKNLPWARQIAKILNLEENHLQVIQEKVAYPTVTIVIGKDYVEWLP